MPSLFNTRTNNRKILKLFFITISVVIIIGYAFWRSLNYTKGPSLIISFPPNNSATSSRTLIIYGQAERVNNVSLNGRSITIDENGNFSEYMALFPGVNIFSLSASDQFQRQVKKELTVMGI